MRVARSLILVVAVTMLTVPGLWAQDVDGCETLVAKMETRASAPGAWVGSVRAGLVGAVAFETVSRLSTAAEGGPTLLTMTFVDRREESMFEALLTAVDSPRSDAMSPARRKAEGEILKGTGRFSDGVGTIVIDGLVDARRFDGEVTVRRCR